MIVICTVWQEQIVLPGPVPWLGPKVWQDQDRDQGQDQKYDGTGTKDRDWDWDRDWVWDRDHDKERNKDLYWEKKTYNFHW